MSDGDQVLEEALARLAERRVLLVATDLDGALAEFTQDPEATVPAPGGMEALRGLAAMPDTHVAVVSGRDVETLVRLTGVGRSEPVVLIGSHGAESNRPEVAPDGALDADQRQLLDGLVEQMAELIDRHPHARLERKGAAVAVHTRGLPEQDAEAALAEAVLLGDGRPDVRVMRGKSVVELSVSHADKGTAVLALARAVRADATLYCGDDVTDEDAFLALDPARGDVTVKVGSGETAATHRVDDVNGLVRVLQRLESLRAEAGG